MATLVVIYNIQNICHAFVNTTYKIDNDLDISTKLFTKCK